MALIPEETIQQVREAHDIIDVISEYVKLRKSGRTHMGLCPFHSEKTPSFSVVPDKQFFYCFGCHAGGDVIKFVMDIEGHTYIEAIKELADKAGIRLPEVEEDIETEELSKKKRMIEAHELAAKLFHHVLLNTKYGENARSYLQARGFSRETLIHYQIGYAPTKSDFLTDFLKRREFHLPEMVEAGLLSANEEQSRFYDRFVNRIMFPIEDGRSRIIAFGGRILGEGQPKYLNSPESPIFYKRAQLYNLARAKREIRRRGQVILFEGYGDSLQSTQAGIENNVATMGTGFTPEMSQIIRRYASQVTICFDSDEAGMDAAARAAEVLDESGITVRIAKLPEGMDPDDYVRQEGGEHFRHRILNNAIPITAYRLERLRKGMDLSNSEERRRYVGQALEQIAILSSAIERDHYMRVLSDEFDIPVEVIRQDLHKYRSKVRRRQKFRDNTTNKWNTNINNGTHMSEKELRPAYYNAERKILAMMLKDIEVTRLVMEEIGGDFNDSEHLAIAAEIYACVSEGVTNISISVLHRLSEPELQRIVTSLIMDEIEEPMSDQGMQELIKCILDYPKQKELEEMIKLRQEALEMEDFAKARQLDREIREIQKEIKPYLFKSI